MKNTFVPSVNIQLLMNGNLEMSLNPSTRKWVKANYPEPQTKETEAEFVKGCLLSKGYWQILPEDCGALTDATLITDGKDVWGDMSYQVKSFLEELVKGNKVIWQKG